jgi:hypothetical protein
MEAKLPIFVWLLLAAASLYLLQSNSPFGIYLMFLNAGLITGILLMLSLGALFVEALVGRVPRWFAVVPAFAVGGYYFAVISERSQLGAAAEKLAVKPATSVIAYDPARNSIELSGTDPNYLLAGYQIPFVYSSNEGWRRMIGVSRSCQTRYQLNKPVPLGTPIAMAAETLGMFCFQAEKASLPSEGHLTFRPSTRTVDVNGLHIHVSEIAVRLDDREAGLATTSATTELLHPFPLPFVGCALVSSKPAWECAAAFLKEQVEVWPNTGESRSYSRARKRENDAIATLLSLVPRSPDEINAMTWQR